MSNEPQPQCSNQQPLATDDKPTGREGDASFTTIQSVTSNSASKVQSSDAEAAPRSEQDWTPERIGDIWSEKFKGRKRNWRGSMDVSWNERQAWEAVADAHKAALAAMKEECDDVMDKHEQQLATEREANRGLYIESNERYRQLLAAQAGDKYYRGLFDEIRQAVRELTPIDATKKEIIDRVKSLVSSLLQAQAAIAEAKRLCQSAPPFEGYSALEAVLDAIDLSALDKHDAAIRAEYERADWVVKHDAEVRKPLVEALESYEYDENGHIVTWLSQKAWANALAKVKERK